MIDAGRCAVGREQLQRLTDEQWRDAFRAGNYAEPDRRALHPPHQARRSPTAWRCAPTPTPDAAERR